MASTIPRPEYPRPQFRRANETWLNLNGPWQFEMDPGTSGEARGLHQAGPEAFSRAIIVPFAMESALSGVEFSDFMPCVWYRRTVVIPDGWDGKRILLHFGAVDYDATAWVNGRKAGFHRGGHVPFTFDVTDLVESGENVITVRAVDDSRDRLKPRGKQSDRYDSYGCHYTRTTGIWQTVWMEAVPRSYVSSVRLTPDLAGGKLVIQARVEGSNAGIELRATASADGDGTEVAAASTPSAWHGTQLVLDVGPDVRAWSIEDPFLYDLKLELVRGGDVVDSIDSYFGLRSVSIEGPAILLNGKPVFQRLVLDQGYYPDGVMTAPSDDALKRDIELSQAMGFNGARLHMKVFEPRLLYWADKLGYIVWGEFPNWRMDLTQGPALERHLAEWLDVLDRDFSHPSIVGWCPFNETANDQNDEVLRIIYETTKAVDRTRPVIDTSGYVHVKTDVDDCHNYNQNVEEFAALFEPMKTGGEAWRNRKDREAPHLGQPYFVSEYGGIWWDPTALGGQPGWGYGDRPRSEEEFLARYRGLTETLLNHPGMCGFCYTQLYDIEQEVNGLYTYDRRQKFDPEVIAAINRQPAAIEEGAGDI